jgi:hypothetical protein
MSDRDERPPVPPISPRQLQWVLDHNMQIRAGHRVQIANAVEAWREDQAQLADLRSRLTQLRDEMRQEQKFYEIGVEVFEDEITRAMNRASAAVAKKCADTLDAILSGQETT